ncbi:MAG: TonB-dependent receptor [Candidatus Omnitrophota bacterium]
MKTFLQTMLVACFLTATARTVGTEPVEIDSIVVTADRTQENMHYSTKNVTVIEQQDIRNSNAQNIPDVLRMAGGVLIRDFTGIGRNVNADMRGFGETGPSNMLVLVDGRRVNAIDLSGTDWSQIALSQVERIEIVRGANSVLYGDNAASGVVNVITKKGNSKPQTTLEQKGGSYGMRSTTIESLGASETSSYRVSAEYLTTNGYRENNDFERRDFGLQFGHTFDPRLTVNLIAGHHSDDYGLPGTLKVNELNAYGRRATVKPNDKADSEDSFLNLEILNDFADAGQLETHMSCRLRQSNARYFSASWKNENQINMFTLTPKYTFEAKIGPIPNNKLICGLDLTYAEDNILDGGLTGTNDKICIKKSSIGFYIQDQVDLLDNLSFKGGYRHETAAFDFHQITQVDLKEKSNLSDDVFSAGLNYRWSKDTSLYAEYALSFRYPLVDEFFASNTYGFGGLNSSLSAQKGRNVEAGLRRRLTKNLDLKLNYFYHFILNEIYFDPGTFVNGNYDRTVRQGGELQTDYRVSDALALFASYTLTDARFGRGAYKGKQIPAVPEHMASAGLRLQWIEPLRINLVANYVGSSYLISDQNNAYPKLDDYVTVDLNLNYAFKNTEVFLGIHNIFDEEYSEYGVISVFSSTRSFYPAPGRNVIAGCRYKF